MKNGPKWAVVAADVKTKSAHQCKLRSSTMRIRLKKNPNLDPELLQKLEQNYRPKIFD